MSEYKKGEINSYRNVLGMIAEGLTVKQIEHEIYLDVQRIKKQAEENEAKNS